MGRGGRRDPSEYITVTAEIFYCKERRRTRVRPIQGQPFPPNMKIECSKKVRSLPLGSLIELRVVETGREDGEKFLYSSYKWPVNILSS